jgi:hypothetical protein
MAMLRFPAARATWPASNDEAVTLSLPRPEQRHRGRRRSAGATSQGGEWDRCPAAQAGR